MMEGALSGKTGFTNKAGYCYVGAFERDGKRFTIALLGCGWPNHKTWKWADSKALFSYGFTNYTYHSLSEASYDEKILSPVPVLKGRTEEIGGEAKVEVKTVESGENKLEGLLLSAEENIVVSWEVKNKLTAPVEENRVVGRIRYTVGEECLKEILIMTREEVLKIDFFWCLKQVLREFAL